MVILIDNLKIVYLSKRAIETIEVNKDTEQIEITTCHYRYTITSATITKDETEFVAKFGSASYMNAFSILNENGKHNSLFITGKITKTETASGQSFA